MAKQGSKHKPEHQSELAVIERRQTKQPRRYHVVLHNDDYTTMEFVVHVLVKFFHKDETEATRIMLNVHIAGVGLCGVYTYEIAETKVDTVHTLANEHGFPLKCTMERE